MTACVTAGKPCDSRNETADLSWTCSLLEVAVAKHQNADSYRRVPRVVHMSTWQCVAQHILEDWDQLVAHTRVWSLLFEVRKRTTGCRCAVEGHRDGRN